MSARLLLDEIVEDDYTLFAIHSPMESYRLAFILNKQLYIRLERRPKDVLVHSSLQNMAYTLYSYVDEQNYQTYYLIKNRSLLVDGNTTFTSSTQMHLETQVALQKKLIPEKSNVDYFLKIESERNSRTYDHLLVQLRNIPQIASTYTLDYTQLKSKNNLIFT